MIFGKKNSLSFALYIVLLAFSLLGTACGKKAQQENPTQTAEETTTSQADAISNEAPLEAVAEPQQEQTAAARPALIAFYNVENLFDVEDDPKINDDDFLPKGKQKWTKERYQTKLKKLAEAIAKMHPEGKGAELLGVCEVENRRVLEDLIQTPPLDALNYGIIHQDSNDGRGIDVALLYKKEAFVPTQNALLPIPNKKTRGVLQVAGKLWGEPMNLFVNHFPSRREGKEESEGNRLQVAEVARKAIDALLMQNPDANIIVMGDFNDEPQDKSIVEGLKSRADKNLKAGELYNPFHNLAKAGKGTYNYRGEWNMLDQMLISKSLLDKKGLKFEKSDIFAPEWLKQQQPEKYRGNPDRTYVGERYLGGYSDHFPIYMQLIP
ncbi:hypothetical protein [Hugenholtzia roseola]|uniref:endonuclease/exonuclease/phosphatase family protein n=1 Tax=Hugenholtzia roseola TaxID=1002 RepID=UPI00040D502A|nr:hypothetical protein [Hugenholtzia roseola]